MDCPTAREAISAALDGELDRAEARRLADHLGDCPGCRDWREHAHAVTRRARLTAAPAGSGAPSELVARVLGTPPVGRRVAGAVWLRAGLVFVALGQIALTVPALVLGSDREAPIHVAHELGSFDLALAVGLLVAAWRPARARGMTALVGVAALALVVTATIDLVAGRTTLADEAPHLLAVAGWALLWALAARERERERPRPALAGAESGIPRRWLGPPALPDEPAVPAGAAPVDRRRASAR